MKWLKSVDKITQVVEKSVTDKDQRNALIANISLILMQSKVAPYVRGVLAIVTITGCMFFGDKITIEPDTQKILLSSIFGFYFIDFVKSMFKK